jgi:hypothetical protein
MFLSALQKVDGPYKIPTSFVNDAYCEDKDSCLWLLTSSSSLRSARGRGDGRLKVTAGTNINQNAFCFDGRVSST